VASPVGTAIIGVIAVFFLVMGLYALAAPAALVRPFGMTLAESASRSEVRAVYGGFGLAIAGVLVFAAANPGDLRAGIFDRRGRRVGGHGVRPSCRHGHGRSHVVLSQLVVLCGRGDRSGRAVRGSLRVVRNPAPKGRKIG
jgi:hypothetical protein